MKPTEKVSTDPTSSRRDVLKTAAGLGFLAAIGSTGLALLRSKSEGISNAVGAIIGTGETNEAMGNLLNRYKKYREIEYEEDQGYDQLLILAGIFHDALKMAKNNGTTPDLVLDSSLKSNYEGYLSNTRSLLHWAREDLHSDNKVLSGNSSPSYQLRRLNAEPILRNDYSLSSGLHDLALNPISRETEIDLLKLAMDRCMKLWPKDKNENGETISFKNSPGYREFCSNLARILLHQKGVVTPENVDEILVSYHYEIGELELSEFSTDVEQEFKKAGYGRKAPNPSLAGL